MPVVYVSRDESTKPTHMWILEGGVLEDGASVDGTTAVGVGVLEDGASVDGTTAVGVVASSVFAPPFDGSAFVSAVGDEDDTASGGAEVEEFLQKPPSRASWWQTCLCKSWLTGARRRGIWWMPS